MFLRHAVAQHSSASPLLDSLASRRCHRFRVRFCTYGEAGVARRIPMALQYAANSRLVTYDKNICPQCSAWLLAPDWSEHFNERCVRHSWSCDACGYGFETTVVFPQARKTAA